MTFKTIANKHTVCCGKRKYTFKTLRGALEFLFSLRKGGEGVPSKEIRKLYMRAFAKEYYHTVAKNDPAAMARRYEYHAEWQRVNKDRFNAYHNEYRRKRRSVANAEPIREGN